MVLGIRSKSRKSVSIQVHYIIHVQEIKPWPPSQSLISAQSVLLQWQNGDQSSGSLASSAGDGKIGFNESFRLSVLMWREASKKSKQRESFQKNCLEFCLYDKTGKSQLLGSATINLADIGIPKETKAISTQLNCKKSSRNSAQPFLYVSIQPFDIECSSSSPNSSLSKELSIDKEESESVSQSANDDDLEIASFTDDESEDIPSNTFKSIRSSSETAGDSTKISKGETRASNDEFVQPLENTTSSLLGNAKGEASTRLDGIKSPSSSMVLSSDMRSEANGRLSLPRMSDKSVKVADASSKIRESIQQLGNPEGEASTRLNGINSPSSSTVLSSDMGTEATGRPSLPRVSDKSVKVADVSSKTPESIQQLGNAKGEASIRFNGIKSSSSSTVLSSVMGSEANSRPSLPRISDKSVKFADSSFKIPESIQQSWGQNITKGDMVTAISLTSYISSSMQPNSETSSQFQVTQEDSMTQEDSTRDQRHDKDSLEKVTSVSNTRVLDGKEKMDKRRKGHEQFTARNELLENELVNNFSNDHSTRKEKSSGATHLLTNKSHEHPTSILMNDKGEDVRTQKFSSQSAESHGLLSRSQTQDQAEEINASNDVHDGAVCRGDINVNDSFPNDITELKAEIEMLREELREAAALEVSLYSVIAEHGSSSNKVHAPARRLSRFYFHACRVGSPAMIASAAQSAVSGFVLVSKACGNDVPRLTFWFSNLILLRAIVSTGVEKRHLGDGPCINSECDGNDPHLHEEEKENAEKQLCSWEDLETFLVALEKVEAWIFSRIVESVWWQTLTPYMQSAAAKSSSSKKINGRRHGIGDQDQGSFSIDLWERAFKDACDRLCPLRAGGHECGCLPVIARLVMEQLVNRLDVAMFNAILRESDDEMPTDPISDPISDSKVLPIPAGKSGFGAGAQLKNAIGNWSRWLSDLFGTDDSDSREDSNENNEAKWESVFKPFRLLNALSDLMMLPFEMLADESMRKEVCPKFGVSLIRRVVCNFVPDEFSPGPIPDAVLEALYNEDIQDDEGSITSFPCTAGSTFYAPPPTSSIVGLLQEVGTQNLLRRGSFALKKLYTSDDELEELDSPFSALGMDETLPASKKKFPLNQSRKVFRYELLREVWRSSE